MADDKKLTDLLGVQPLAKAVEIGAHTASELLLAVCKPAAEELGQFLAECVRAYRHKNAVDVLALAVDIVRKENGDKPVSAPPALVYRVLEESSWEDNDEIKALWAGLLASACSEDGKDDGNKIFMRMLRGLTGVQARILFMACREVDKFVSPTGLPWCGNIEASLAAVEEIAGITDIQQLDRDLDDLRHLGLLDPMSGGFIPEDAPQVRANLSPSLIALNLYVRCQGSRKSVGVYFDAPTRENPLPMRTPVKVLKGSKEP
jgi:hypothetical protein